MTVFSGASLFIQNYRATAPRRVKPFILAAIHITGNSSIPSAIQEANYANRYGSTASATFYTNRNGTFVQCLHPEYQIPFTNGWWNRPNTGLWTVQRALQYGYGANDSTFLTIENVGFESAYPITAAQIETCARLIAQGSKKSGIPINRNTVLGHRDYNSVSRYYCPTGGSLSTLLNKIITRAQQINAVAPAPSPSTTVVKAGGLPVTFTSRSGWKATIKAGKPRRSGASVSASNYANTDSNGEPIPVWGEVAGEDMSKYGLAGGRRWFFGPQYISGKGWKVVYIPYADLTNRQFS